MSTDINMDGDPRWEGLARPFLDFQKEVTSILQKAVEDPRTDIKQLNRQIQELVLRYEGQSEGANQDYNLMILVPAVTADDLQEYTLDCEIAVRDIKTQKVEDRRMFPIIF
ncbi:MAG: hypothetical protein UU65_C0002G0241 [candidate division CPR2 bacterium GW2011_GWC1_41_48]|uniref:Uncharacterized protein n=1 Tax=candidate division CPR2 bacterium GW2011_GWC1_41_48 TaxID=1618344 RepID=A0A0G0Z8S4_UNCC2|nr:MAG: hypothetical protein UT47_C0002G0063 [candidate division CPR2 bacterium GW2011_GWC2_39_35]KKR28926.1 MAG: hypothetical protein UT59_C0015G0005 [candidate division CPR2 bacterium GW2011_GWD1_39_7]KKR28966.1 MAG: hypothetical protein UT60_C0008G0009 [candidate division CPR2 bacterium GW2011_GWD2_39_7]KKS09463.1 MAG: hypothetical protein UU65_C0002G0241 [candidate division CPR2 bacterium GW2011_GWC1_41_48]